MVWPDRPGRLRPLPWTREAGRQRRRAGADRRQVSNQPANWYRHADRCTDQGPDGWSVVCECPYSRQRRWRNPRPVDAWKHGGRTDEARSSRARQEVVAREDRGFAPDPDQGASAPWIPAKGVALRTRFWREWH